MKALQIGQDIIGINISNGKFPLPTPTGDHIEVIEDYVFKKLKVVNIIHNEVIMTDIEGNEYRFLDKSHSVIIPHNDRMMSFYEFNSFIKAIDNRYTYQLNYTFKYKMTDSDTVIPFSLTVGNHCVYFDILKDLASKAEL